MQTCTYTYFTAKANQAHFLHTFNDQRVQQIPRSRKIVGIDSPTRAPHQ